MRKIGAVLPFKQYICQAFRKKFFVGPSPTNPGVTGNRVAVLAAASTLQRIHWRSPRRTPYKFCLSDFVVEKSVAIGPLFPMFDQARTHRILANIIPLLVNRLRGSEEPIESAGLPLAICRKFIHLVKPAFQPLQEGCDASFALERRGEQMDVIRHRQDTICVPFVQTF